MDRKHIFGDFPSHQSTLNDVIRGSQSLKAALIMSKLRVHIQWYALIIQLMDKKLLCTYNLDKLQALGYKLWTSSYHHREWIYAKKDLSHHLWK